MITLNEADRVLKEIYVNPVEKNLYSDTCGIPYIRTCGGEPYRRKQPKIGANDPCPCGSGKKYKRCCG